MLLFTFRGDATGLWEAREHSVVLTVLCEISTEFGISSLLSKRQVSQNSLLHTCEQIAPDVREEVRRHRRNHGHQLHHQRRRLRVSIPHTRRQSAVAYSDEKVANRDIRVWHFVKWLLNDGKIQNPSAQS